MKIWIKQNAPENQPMTALNCGPWDDQGTGAETLCTVRAGDELSPAAAWLLAPGHALAADLMDALSPRGGDVYAPVNGLAGDGVALLRQRFGADRLVLAFDPPEGLPELDYVEQLAWLSRQPERFAVIATENALLLPAALAGAAAVLIGDAATVDFAALDRIARQTVEDTARPINAAETEALAGQELCLTVARPMRAGETITPEDLAVAVTGYRGLSPTLRDRIIGRALRYDIAPGEALHFGHIG